MRSAALTSISLARPSAVEQPQIHRRPMQLAAAPVTGYDGTLHRKVSFGKKPVRPGGQTAVPGAESQSEASRETHASLQPRRPPSGRFYRGDPVFIFLFRPPAPGVLDPFPQRFPCLSILQGPHGIPAPPRPACRSSPSFPPGGSSCRSFRWSRAFRVLRHPFGAFEVAGAGKDVAAIFVVFGGGGG